jgi:hypothetical protein
MKHTLRDALRKWPLRLLENEAVDLVKKMSKNDLTMFLEEYNAFAGYEQDIIDEAFPPEDNLTTEVIIPENQEKFNFEKA